MLLVLTDEKTKFQPPTTFFTLTRFLFLLQAYKSAAKLRKTFQTG